MAGKLCLGRIELTRVASREAVAVDLVHQRRDMIEEVLMTSSTAGMDARRRA